MESMRVIPIVMFLTGVLMIYSGFKNVAPLDVIRGNIRGFQDWDESDQGYGTDDDPFYGGVPLYHSPGFRSGPGGF